MKTALLFGPTGLVGSELMRRIVNDAHYSHLKIFTRRPFRTRNLNSEVIQMDFNEPESAAHLITGDDCFCCIGTTMKKAGSKEAFRKTDLDLVMKIAQIALTNGVKNFILVSSIGASESSSNFYLKTKGELEKALQELPFGKVIIVRPSILLGKRNEFRLGESIGILVARLASPLMIFGLKKYKPIQAKAVAKAMLKLANSNQKKNIFESNELRKLGI